MNDQDEVARLRRDCEKPVEALLDEFTTVRATSVMAISGLTGDQLARRGRHPTVGTLTIGNLLHEWVYHDLHHLKQIGGNVQGALWEQLGTLQAFYA